MSNLYFTKVIPIFDMAKFFHMQYISDFFRRCTHFRRCTQRLYRF